MRDGHVVSTGTLERSDDSRTAQPWSWSAGQSAIPYLLDDVGDTAVEHTDGAYTFHGRSDEVMNVGGNRISTEEIENAILRYNESSASLTRVANCAVTTRQGWAHRAIFPAQVRLPASR